MRPATILVLSSEAIDARKLLAPYLASSFDERYLATIGVVAARLVVHDQGESMTCIVRRLAYKGEGDRVFQVNARGASACLVIVDAARPETVDAAVAMRRAAVDVIGDVPTVAIVINGGEQGTSDVNSLAPGLAAQFFSVSRDDDEGIARALEAVAAQCCGREVKLRIASGAYADTSEFPIAEEPEVAEDATPRRRILGTVRAEDTDSGPQFIVRVFQPGTWISTWMLGATAVGIGLYVVGSDCQVKFSMSEVRVNPDPTDDYYYSCTLPVTRSNALALAAAGIEFVGAEANSLLAGFDFAEAEIEAVGEQIRKLFDEYATERDSWAEAGFHGPQPIPRWSKRT